MQIDIMKVRIREKKKTLVKLCKQSKHDWDRFTRFGSVD